MIRSPRIAIWSTGVFFSSRRRHTRCYRDWSSDVCSSDLVPIFEQCLAPDGSLLAWECEAHDGLHTVEENEIVELNSDSALILTSLTDHRHPAIRVITPLTASFQEGTCGCGQSGPRITGLATRSPRRDWS